MAKAVTTAKIETQVKHHIAEAQKWMERETGQRVPDRRRSYAWENSGHRVTLYGETLGNNPIADYEGPYGQWRANFTHRGPGKPHVFVAARPFGWEP